MREAFRHAITVEDAPTVVRYPKGPVGEDLPAKRSVGAMDVLAEHGDSARVAFLGLGPMASTAVEAADKVAAEGHGTLAASATWVHPVPEGLLELVGDCELVVTIEDGLADAGLGQEWAEAARVAGLGARWQHRGVPREFLQHASRAQIIEESGLEASAIADDVLALLSED